MDDVPKKIFSGTAIFVVVGVVMLVLLGGTFTLGGGKGDKPQLSIPGALDWLLEHRGDAVTKTDPLPPKPKVSPPLAPKATTPSASSVTQSSIPSPAANPVSTEELVTGEGTFATVEMSGLTPGTHISTSLFVPNTDGTLILPQVEIGTSGLFRIQLPRLVRSKKTGVAVDLSLHRYAFYISTDEERFSHCSSRRVVMVEGRTQFRFLPADRVFCGKNDGALPLYP